MYEPESDRGFLEGVNQGLKETGSTNIRVEVLEMHINDPAFAEAAAKRLDAMIRENRKAS